MSVDQRPQPPHMPSGPTTPPPGSAPGQAGEDRRNPVGHLAYVLFVPPWVRRKRARQVARQTSPTTTARSHQRDRRRRGGGGPLRDDQPAAPTLTNLEKAVASAGAHRAASAGDRDTSPDRAPATRELGRRAPLWQRLLGWDRIEENSLFSSTRQAEALNPLLVETHQAMAGPPAGVDVLTNNALSADPHLLYEQKRITSPHFSILGALGTGKTSFAMTQYVMRQVAMGKQVAVFDRKKQQEDGSQGEGEYTGAAKECAGEIIRFAQSGSATLNLMDPRIAAASDEKAGVVGQDALLRLAAEYAHGPLTSKEGAALASAHRLALAVAKAENRIATIHDVIRFLFDPTPESIPHESLRRRNLVDEDEMVRWGLELALDLQRFVEGDLSGLIDGDTSTAINWDAPLLVFDTSELPENSPALSLVMMLVSSFLSSVWSARQAKRVIILEEGYHTSSLAGPGAVTVAGILRSLLKRGRGIGLSFGIVVHHIGDIPADSDAVAMLKETGIVHVYRQDKTDDIVAVVEQYGFPTNISETLRDLEQGVQIIRIGSEPPRLLRHVRSALERNVTDSDAALVGRAKLGTELRNDDEDDASSAVDVTLEVSK